MILDEIVKRKKKDLVRWRDERPLADLKAKARAAAPVPDFAAALRTRGEVSIIAEFKRASPSRGILKKEADPAAQAEAYRAGGARAISVLTDEPFFRGSVADLRAARMASLLPVLRKDFILDPYQLYESRVMLASAVLLIARILERNQLADYLAMAREDLGLDALVEVHTEKELEAALDAAAPIVGINNRNLEDFSVSLETTARLRPRIPDGATVVSESGIEKREDVVLLGQLGVDAALIGEGLMTADDPAAALRKLRGAADEDARDSGRRPGAQQHA